MHCGIRQWVYLGFITYKILIMKTEHYNPSQLEVEFSYALTELQKELEKFLTHNSISKVENKIKERQPYGTISIWLIKMVIHMRW